MKAVILLGGGLDTCSLLAWLSTRREIEWVKGLFVDYGQKAVETEREANRFFCQKYGYEYKEVRADLSQILHGGVMKGEATKKVHEDNVVPARNLVLLSMGGAFAASCGADSLLVAFHKEPDNTGFPDATQEFLGSFQGALWKALGKRSVYVFAPFRDLERHELVRVGKKADEDVLSMSATCYEGKRGGCGKCTHCLKKKEIMEKL